jgi:hypothetical protein
MKLKYIEKKLAKLGYIRMPGVTRDGVSKNDFWPVVGATAYVHFVDCTMQGRRDIGCYSFDKETVDGKFYVSSGRDAAGRFHMVPGFTFQNAIFYCTYRLKSGDRGVYHAPRLTRRMEYNLSCLVAVGRR